MSLRDWWHSLLVSLQFLTSIPVHKWFAQARQMPSAQVAGNALLFYPLVGLLIGALLLLWPMAVDYWQLNVSMAINAALVLMLWVFLTGALHLDGLGDSADAWLGGFGDKERTLTIMKDPTSGPIAVTVLVLVLLLKWALLGQLLEQQQWLPLLLVPLLARLQVMNLVIYTPYVRSQGLGSELKNQAQSVGFWLQFIAIAIALALLQYWHGLILLGVVMIIGWYWRALMVSRLDGWTGDTAGANIELQELALLLAAVLLMA